MEEKIMKCIMEETREILEKGTHEPKKKKKKFVEENSLYPKAKVCGRCISGIAVSNHAEGMMFVVLCVVWLPDYARS